jgi:hypothetical protein
MARRKKTPEISKITRVGTVAYARKQKPEGAAEGGGSDAGSESADETAAAAPGAPAASGEAAAAGASAASGEAGLDDRFDVTDRSQPMPVASDPKATAAKPAVPAVPAVPAAAPKPAPPPAPPEEAGAGVRDTAAMPVLAPVGQPPEMPSTPVPAGVSPRADAVEDPTNMPGAKEIPAGSPGDPAAAPGRVPPGDSRSLRRRDATTYEFALIYRRATFVITRFGVVGTRGQWRVVEYPTSAAASHAYAKECSRFVSEGFSDYRE